MHWRVLVPLAIVVGSAWALAACDRVSKAAESGNPFASFESRCERLPRASVSVTTAPIVVKRHDDRSIAELTELGPPHFAAQRTVGLTRGELVADSNIELNGLSDLKAGRACVRPRVQVRLSVAPVNVYVAREYRDEACRHASILEHEQKHVEVYRALLGRVAPRLRAELILAVGNEITYAPSIADAQAALKAKVGGVVSAFQDSVLKEVEDAQAAVDTPEEYDRVDRQCASKNAGEAL